MEEQEDLFYDEGGQIIEDEADDEREEEDAQIDSSSKPKYTLMQKRPAPKICICFPEDPIKNPDPNMRHRMNCNWT